ncbi:hypothetical protein [Cupriavidus sp. AcVe19-6a]|uniref:hypothetical protein n=1 Tax=Cupriavidus sp. AcVe19-6a TaxID=2821358 RepID=UPI001AE1DF15|nr:hypothetical protein [Cupriavidus sp. AcVe19-6a]MBP0634242.1 hypothetical protein [Cupriavidus sp. AcVe19-6a]
MEEQDLMPVFGPGGWCAKHGRPIIASDNALRYFLSPEIKDELVASGIIFFLGAKMMTDDPRALKAAVVEILKERSKARISRHRVGASSRPLASVTRGTEADSA